MLGEKKESERKRKEAEAAAIKAAEEAARKSGDVAALEKSWKEKTETEVGEWKGRFESERSHVQRLLVDNVAAGLANELALQGSANVLLPHVRSRLAVDYVDGVPMTRVLGPDGKPSAATIDELKSEFAANTAFAPIIAGSKASGSGASGAGRGGAASKTMKRADFDQLGATDKAKAMRDGVTLTD